MSTERRGSGMKDTSTRLKGREGHTPAENSSAFSIDGFCVFYCLLGSVIIGTIASLVGG